VDSLPRGVDLPALLASTRNTASQDAVLSR